jgi:hypothetical protein
MEDKATPSTQANSDRQGDWTALRCISSWYWGAIGVIVLAGMAQFFQAAPTMMPATVASAVLAPGISLQVAYPETVRPVLREADKTPLALTLQGVGVITYTVALSSSTPLIFMDSRLQIVAPRAELAVNGCCQSSTLLYPQATTGVGWWTPITITVFAATASVATPGAPVLEFAVKLEPVWWTWGRRAILVFADLGLAVAIALAFSGWALDRKRREEEHQKERNQEQKEDEARKRQLEVRHQARLWQAQVEHAKKMCEHDLLAGVTALLALKGTLTDNPEHNRRRTALDTVLQSYTMTTTDPDSLAGERCLGRVAARIKTRHVFLETELDALDLLFHPTPAAEDATNIRPHVRALSSRGDVTSPEYLLQATMDMQHRFEYSPAIRDLTIEMIVEWYDRISKDNGQEIDIDGALAPLRYLLHDPRLAHIPFMRRTRLYDLPTVLPYQYAWANPDDIAAIASTLQIMLKIDLHTFAEVPSTLWRPRLPSAGFASQPRILKFPTHEDAECGAHLLHAHLITTALESFQAIDGAADQVAGTLLDEGAGKPLCAGFVPFSVPIFLTMDTPQFDRPLLAQLTQLAYGVGEEWIALLACSPSIWGGLSTGQQAILARLLQFVTRTNAELQYRLLLYRQSNRCRHETAVAIDGKSSKPGFARQDNEAIIKKLVAGIVIHWQDAAPVVEVDANRMETWLTLRPAYFTHTVVVALINPTPKPEATASLWLSWFHLAKRLRERNVVVHLLAAQLPGVPLLQCVAEDCTVSVVQLAALLDDVFGFRSSRFSQRDMRDDGADGCRIEAISRLLDIDSFDIADEVTDALLDKAGGSPSRLLHMMHLILKNRLATTQANEPEFKLSHLDVMSVVQTYPKDR